MIYVAITEQEDHSWTWALMSDSVGVITTARDTHRLAGGGEVRAPHSFNTRQECEAAVSVLLPDVPVRE